MSTKRIKSALVSVFYKDGLDEIIKLLHADGVQLISTGGTQQFIESLGIPCTAVESLTGYPSILGGRVKTLHPKVFGGILGRRELEKDQQQMAQLEKQAEKLSEVEAENERLKEQFRQIDELRRNDIRVIKAEYQEQVAFLREELKAWRSWHQNNH